MWEGRVGVTLYSFGVFKSTSDCLSSFEMVPDETCWVDPFSASGNSQEHLRFILFSLCGLVSQERQGCSYD